MHQNNSLFQRLIAYCLLLSLFLQNCNTNVPREPNPHATPLASRHEIKNDGSVVDTEYTEQVVGDEKSDNFQKSSNEEEERGIKSSKKNLPKATFSPKKSENQPYVYKGQAKEIKVQVPESGCGENKDIFQGLEKEEDKLKVYDYKEDLQIQTHLGSLDNIPVICTPINIVGPLGKAYEIDGRRFSC